MISILIPVYNREVGALVASLHAQLQAVTITGEIIVMDDGSENESTKNANRGLPGLFNTLLYIELPVNTGRNLIRHELAAAARFDLFIFLDADSSFPDTAWLKRYLNAAAGNAVIMGGRSYKPETPGAASSLHFHYGQQREQLGASRRNKHPYRSFMACNFLVSRNQFAQLITDRRLHGYCHEDTFMGLQFEQLRVLLVHIDNPVYHEGIDEDQLFMKKQAEALQNLRYLYQTYHTRYHFNSGIKLIRVYQKLQTTAAGRYILQKLALQQDALKKNTLRSHRLLLLDLWKLGVYHQLCAAPGSNKI
ncbi:MAG: glycosyltransferase family 2 protein [Bacteroidota bacterium]